MVWSSTGQKGHGIVRTSFWKRLEVNQITRVQGQWQDIQFDALPPE